MILVDEPYYNEPGHELYSNRKQSTAYNKDIQQHTMRYALLGWLNERLAQPSGAAVPGTVSEAPTSAITRHLFHSASPAAGTSTAGAPKDDPIWGEIIRKHFAANGKAIMETVKKWKQTECKGLVGELQEALARHGFI
jgi:baculoviral IAP repeat-containing protein 6